ncbi:MAG: DUF3048 domain-containing protein [bacterium]|nr:DUF3048 domain-containing protein [bacterium]
MDKRKVGIIFLTILIYIISTGASFALFSKSVETKKNIASPLPSASKSIDAVVFDQTLPKTEQCPLNGAMYSKQQKDWWAQHRPLGIMIENHEEARPQSGLSSADVVYEAVAEGGITRFLAVYYCQDAGQVGPVRSARTYFLDFISEYGANPLYTHVGGANAPGPADALSQIESYDWGNYNDLNQFSIGFPTFWRDYDRLGHTVATEHTMYSTTAKLWDFAAKSRKLTNVDVEENPWDAKFVTYSFKDDSPSKTPQVVHLAFWKGYDKYFADWIYDPATNLYKRNSGGTPHLDKDNNQQLSAKNVVVLSMIESNADDGYENNLHLLYKTKGSGKASIFMDGKEISGRWRKDTRTARTLLFDSEGNSIKFDRGLIWFEILPTNAEVSVK